MEDKWKIGLPIFVKDQWLWQGKPAVVVNDMPPRFPWLPKVRLHWYLAEKEHGWVEAKDGVTKSGDCLVTAGSPFVDPSGERNPICTQGGEYDVKWLINNNYRVFRYGKRPGTISPIYSTPRPLP